MVIDFLAVSHSIHNNEKQTRAWLMANRDTENIFNMLFTYSDLRHLMIDDGPISQADTATIFHFRESCTEFINSFKLAESAFYRYAFAALRNALEAGIMSVISQEAGDALDPSGRTGRGLQQLPASEMIGKLNGLSNVKHFCKKTDIIEKCRELHQELSALSGGKDAAPGLVCDVPPVSAGFDEKVFIRWTVCLRKTIRLLFTLFILKYPVSLLFTPVEKKFSTGSRGGPFLNSEEMESLIELIDGDDLDMLMNISKTDPYAVHLAEVLNSCLDIAEEEFNRQ